MPSTFRSQFQVWMNWKSLGEIQVEETTYFGLVSVQI